MPRPSDKWLECIVCGAQHDLKPLFMGCPECARNHRKAPLVVRYDYGLVSGFPSLDGAPGMWRWTALLPVGRPFITSLYEGNTPLVPIRHGSTTLFLKNETSNPTWSYKDRANSVSVSMARQFGFSNVIAISTGNHGNAAAAYSSSAGLNCVVLCHRAAPDLQMALMQNYGATVLRGGDQDAMLNALVSRGDWFPCSIICPRGGSANPFGIEGFKTIAFEIVEQLGGRVPDRVYVPVGSGDGLYGIWKGFSELQSIGRADRIPRMMACQAESANPYVRAFLAGKRHLEPVENPSTRALSIAEKIGGDAALRAVYESGGAALQADEQTIFETMRSLAREGLAIEAASSTAVACARAGSGGEGELWVAIGTGAAVKWPPALCEGFVRPEELPDGFTDIGAVLDAPRGNKPARPPRSG